MKIQVKSRHVIMLAIGLTLALVVAMGIRKAKTQKGQRMAAVSEGPSAEMKLTDMEYTEMQKGRRIWTLKAEEAKYFQEDQKTALTRVRLVFFMEDGEEIHLQSQQGVLHAGSKDIELWHAVHAVFPKGYELSTERARYDHKQNLISSETAILITGPDLKLEGKHWKYLIPERRALLGGRVEATLASEAAKRN
ncbi:MAG: LPS export ABC transporter periplasmic protein LptC [Desulforhabdus sp.]|jgi:LPS export ABC transporter protein LptC|nr:LPS export ABC transporter periplasmic protein LptC [Desulforhabdus sp.]